MHPILSVLAPERIATEAFSDATAAVTRLEEIYERNTRFLRDRFEAFAKGETPTRTRARHLSICAHHDLDPCAARFTPVLRTLAHERNRLRAGRAPKVCL